MFVVPGGEGRRRHAVAPEEGRDGIVRALLADWLPSLATYVPLADGAGFEPAVPFIAQLLRRQLP